MLTPTSTSPNISSSVKRAADGLIAVILAACSIIRDRIAFRRKIERISVDSVLGHHPVKGTVFPPTIDSRLVSCPFATSSQECLHLILDEQIICDHVKRPITVKLLDLDGAIDRLLHLHEQLIRLPAPRILSLEGGGLLRTGND